ncbi:MAG TPA: TetR family transcriptional regulator, partial [Methanothrix sp.]|nr:TetR family transcriptional regulator [Methanothrix sp.]
MISPVYDAPLLLAEGEEKVLVAADLHLGLEHELHLCGISIPSQTEKILHRLLGYIDRIKPNRLVLLGDVKHNVPRTSWQEKKEIPRFLSRLAARVAVDVVPGNHDSDLADMAPPGVQVRPSTGFVQDGVGYFHGHTWPDEKILRAGLLAAATERFVREGYDSVSLREIASDAGVDVSLVSRYFGGKDELFAEVLAACPSGTEMFEGDIHDFGERLATKIVVDAQEDKDL